VDEVAEGDVGESPFEAAQRLEVGLALVALAPVVVPARGRGMRYCTTAAMRSAWSSRRWPPWLSWWRLLSPEDTSTGALPV
jgi:hypothetical protein